MFRDKAKDGTTRITGGISGGDPTPGDPGIVVVEHGTDDSVARPTATIVHWVGSADPLNAEPTDFWTPLDL